MEKSVLERLLGLHQSIVPHGVCMRSSSKLEAPRDHLVFVDGIPLWDACSFEEATFNFKLIEKALKKGKDMGKLVVKEVTSDFDPPAFKKLKKGVEVCETIYQEAYLIFVDGVSLSAVYYDKELVEGDADRIRTALENRELEKEHKND